VNITKAIVFDF